MKPALMTTTVAVVGLIPAAISNEIGAQSQRPLALVIVGGLIPGVMLALIVLPSLYEYFENAFRRNEVDASEEFGEEENSGK
jgi:cobalt-zinc-cadmium resistance protein CzcA